MNKHKVRHHRNSDTKTANIDYTNCSMEDVRDYILGRQNDTTRAALTANKNGSFP